MKIFPSLAEELILADVYRRFPHTLPHEVKEFPLLVTRQSEVGPRLLSA
jgi:hypothetical protein